MNESTRQKKKKKETRREATTESKRDQSLSGSQNKSWGELLQQRRDELRNGSGSSESRRRRNYSESSSTRGGRGTREDIGQTSPNVEKETGCGLEYKFTLKEIYDSIPSDVLKSLINNNFKPNEFVIIKKKSQQSKFIEDLYFRNNQKKKRKSPVRKKIIPPSEYMEKYIIYTFNSEVYEVNNILAHYFAYYKKLFKEEDPEWNSKNMQKAVLLVNSLLEETGTTTMEVMDYIKKIMPLWYNRLINQESFPDRRPTLHLLFNGKRWYWSNRKLLYRQWG